MAFDASSKKEVMEQYAGAAGDTGSTRVQVALLTARIDYLGNHLKTHKKDHAGRRGLLKMVGQRRRLLSYLEKKDFEQYKELIASLGLRR